MRSDELGGGASLQQRATSIIVALVLGAIAVAAFAARGCQEGPFGRSQVVLLNSEQEMALGLDAYKEVIGKAQASVLPSTDPRVQVVKEITRRLAKATLDPRFLKITRLEKYKDRFAKFDWSVEVIRSKEVNAFCLPGGYMVVYTGILPVCENDAALATVMGHELSHALGRHGAERMAQQQMVQVGVAAAGAGVGAQDRQRVMQVLNAGAQFGILSYGRKHESEADHMGLYLMACAGYDPEESVRFWERMKKQSGGGSTPEFLSTHPSHETRIRDLVKWMPEAVKLYQSSPEKTKTRPLPRPPGG
jgi:predicted Zn-dependent protease